MTKEEQLARGERVKTLLNNPDLVAGFEAIEAVLLDTWKKSGPAESLAREDAWRSYTLLQMLQEGLKQHIITGSIASKELLKIREKSKLRNILNG